MFKKGNINTNVTNISEVLQLVNHPDFKVDKSRLAELTTVKDQYEGGKAALSSKYFPAPSREVETLFDNNRKALTHVNYVKIAIRTWLSVICGGDIQRQIKCPNQAIIDAAVKDYGYTDAVQTFVTNGLLYGTSVAYPLYNPETEEFQFVLFDPLKTIIITNPVDVSDVLLVAEINSDFTQFVSKWGEGIIYKNGQAAIQPRNYSYCPVSIGYGIDRRHNREVYGLPFVQDAVDYSLKQTGVAFNISLLQTNQTRDILKIMGDLTKIDHYSGSDGVKPGFDNDGKLFLPEGYEAEFMGPKPMIEQSIAVQKMFSSLYASVSGIPQDIIDPSLTIASGSAEAARIRALPLVHQAKTIVPKWISYETRLLLSMIYLVDYHKADESFITLKDIKARSNIEIRNNYRILPVSPNELTQDVIAKVAAGLMSFEKAVRELDGHITPEELKQLVAEHKENKANETAKQVQDAALKQAANALTPEQKAERDNEK